MTHHEASEVLSRLPGMSGARVRECLADGPTNATYRIVRDGDCFVLRLDKAESLALGLDRENERAVCAAVAAAGLTPAYSHFDLAAGVCLRPFVAGRSLQRDDLLDPRTLQNLARVLRRLHRLPPIGVRTDPVTAARRYAAQLAVPEAERLADQAAAIASDIQRHAPPPGLCHNDLVAANMLETVDKALLLIDWEYAAVGDPFFDLAIVARHHEVGDHLARYLLEAYLQRPPTQSESDRFDLQCRLYGNLLALWNLRVGGAQETAPGRPSGC